MAGYNKYDPRLESLVVETRTHWDEEVGKDLSDEDKKWLAETLHENPRLASKIQYSRTHTGFTREITVTVDDIAQLYEQKFSE